MNVVLDQMIDRRRELLAEIAALQNQVKGLEYAIALTNGEPEEPRRLHVTDMIVKLIREANGAIKPQAIMAIASERGIPLNRGSVYSLINRMERKGELVKVGKTGWKIKDKNGAADHTLAEKIDALEAPLPD